MSVQEESYGAEGHFMRDLCEGRVSPQRFKALLNCLKYTNRCLEGLRRQLLAPAGSVNTVSEIDQILKNQKDFHDHAASNKSELCASGVNSPSLPLKDNCSCGWNLPAGSYKLNIVEASSYIPAVFYKDSGTAKKCMTIEVELRDAERKRTITSHGRIELEVILIFFEQETTKEVKVSKDDKETKVLNIFGKQVFLAKNTGKATINYRIEVVSSSKNFAKEDRAKGYQVLVKAKPPESDCGCHDIGEVKTMQATTVFSKDPLQVAAAKKKKKEESILLDSLQNIANECSHTNESLPINSTFPTMCPIEPSLKTRHSASNINKRKFNNYEESSGVDDRVDLLKDHALLRLSKFSRYTQRSLDTALKQLKCGSHVDTQSVMESISNYYQQVISTGSTPDAQLSQIADDMSLPVGRSTIGDDGVMPSREEYDRLLTFRHFVVDRLGTALELCKNDSHTVDPYDHMKDILDYYHVQARSDTTLGSSNAVGVNSCESSSFLPLIDGLGANREYSFLGKDGLGHEEPRQHSLTLPATTPTKNYE